MAQRVITYVQYTDDLTGEEFGKQDGETVVYAIDGAHYEIDLVASNAKALRELLAPYLQVSRKTVDTRGRKLVKGGGQGTHPEKKRRRTKDEMARIRAWAKENGYPTGENTTTPNRVPFDTVQAYARLVEEA